METNRLTNTIERKRAGTDSQQVVCRKRELCLVRRAKEKKNIELNVVKNIVEI